MKTVKPYQLTISVCDCHSEESSLGSDHVRTYLVNGLPEPELAFVQWSHSGWYVQRIMGQRKRHMSGYYESASAALLVLEKLMNTEQADW